MTGLISGKDRVDFDRDGFIIKECCLPAEQFSQILAEVKAHRGPARETRQGNTVTRRDALAPETLRQLPALRMGLRSTDLQGVLRYAGSYDVSPIFYLQTIFSQALSGPNDLQCDLHSDTFHPTMKAWLFLTDVARDEGPFTYVPGSHRLTAERLAWEWRRSVGMVDDPDRLSRRGSLRMRPEELPDLRLPQAHVFEVPANILVVADTYGFHARGPSARPTQRVEIFAYGRRNPFLPWVGLDPWALESLGQRRIPWYWRGIDAIERLSGRKAQWQKRDNVSPFDLKVLEF